MPLIYIKNIAWLTDIHLNFLNEKARKNFYNEILNANCDTVLISGDIAEALSLVQLLREMASSIKKPIYFVLGNHDYYGGSILDVRQKMLALTEKETNLYWLPACGVVPLHNDILLVGQDGWADARLGDYQNSPVRMNDQYHIEDLFQKGILGRDELLQKMRQLADEDAIHLSHDLAAAVKKNPKSIIVVTHIPPFKQTCKYKGEISDDNWLPYFSSKSTGNVLEKIAQENPNIEFLVLCGHTHNEAYYQPRANLIIKSGKAKYSQPEIQQMIRIKQFSKEPKTNTRDLSLNKNDLDIFGFPFADAKKINMLLYTKDADGFWLAPLKEKTIFVSDNKLQLNCAYQWRSVLQYILPRATHLTSNRNYENLPLEFCSEEHHKIEFRFFKDSLLELSQSQNNIRISLAIGQTINQLTDFVVLSFVVGAASKFCLRIIQNFGVSENKVRMAEHSINIGFLYKIHGVSPVYMYIAKNFLCRSIPGVSKKTIESTINLLMISIYFIKSNNLDASSLLHWGLILFAVFLASYAGKKVGDMAAIKLTRISKSTYTFFAHTESKMNLLQKTQLNSNNSAIFYQTSRARGCG